MKEPNYRIENGRKIYTTIDQIDCVRRPDPKATPPKDAAKSEERNEAGSGDIPPAQSGSGDPDVVSVHMRLITADDAYPSMGWLGPQLVKYGHNGGQAVKEIVGLMNSASRPTPLMWNHSYDAHDIAGKVNDAYWEESSDIKPGANGWARVNKNFDPKAAMGLKTGEINATSIGVVMEKERSHPDMEFETFVTLAAEGSEVDGKQVAWLPIKALEVVHHALVWAGADPNSGPRPVSNTRKTETNGDNAASIHDAEASKINHRGGISVEDNTIKILDSLCKDLGFDVILSEGSIPEGHAARVALPTGEG